MNRRRLYLDNAATSSPKPGVVFEAMRRYVEEMGGSPGRGAYAEAREAGALLLDCRRRLCRLFGADEGKPEQVIFTLNTSDALNLALRGVLDPLVASGRRPHVVTTWMDHNSVLRPLHALSERYGVEVTRVRCDERTGLVDPDDIRAALRGDTAMLACVHGSNVSGALQPLEELGALARERGALFLVDAAQSLGHVPVDVARAGIDLLAFPGHKGLLGPLGTGGLYIRPCVERRMWTVREGGTGTLSEREVQPEFLPDRFEPGSHNAIGLIGLHAATGWILERGIDAMRRHELELIELALERLTDLDEMPGLRLYGPTDPAQRCGVFSVRIDTPELSRPQVLSDLLEREFGILTRSGVHCAPLAHRTFGTAELGGMTRLSVGPFVTARDIAEACEALGVLCRRYARAGV